MAKQPNKLLRAIVPLILLLAGIGIFAAVLVNSRQGATTPQAAPQPAATAPTAAAAATGGATGTTAGTGVVGATGPTGAAPEPAQRAVPLDGLRAVEVESAPFEAIGSIDPAGALEARVEFSPIGAGIASVTLAHHFDTIERKHHTVVQQEHTYTPAAGGPTSTVTPMAANAVEISGKLASLIPTNIWRQTARTDSTATFEATLVNGSGTPVATVHRTYELAPGSFVIRVHQSVKNLTPDPVTVRWYQYGPVELYQDALSYGGDKRRVRFGYLFKDQGSDPTVSATDFVWERGGSSVMGPLTGGLYETIRQIWPNQRSIRYGYRPVWTGQTNRYFGAAMHPLVPPGAGPDQKVFGLMTEVHRVLLQASAVVNGRQTYQPVMILRTTSGPIAVPPGGAADVSTGFYAGPLSRPQINRDPLASAAGLSHLVVYNFGGPCGWCTFDFLTALLLGLLHTLHNYVVFDWALAIIVLVLVVRTILHPVTRWSQIRLQRFGKQMQGMAPKQKKIQEKYKDDPKKLREEMGKLWREEGINPTGALGCIPMFLQTPVWIALYATLYFAIELRHQGAFFGVFQNLTNNRWWFLGDLAEADRFIYFGRTLVKLPVLGEISSFNILPVLLGIVFFIQQKYLTPPPTATMTPEQEQQQKIMKWMMVVMFPLLMYNAPSGLALYFIANSTLGILESKWIRKHIEELDKRQPPPGARKPAGPKPGGFLARLQALAEERQKQMMKAKGLQPPKRKP